MITTCSLTKRYGSGDGRAEVLKGIDIEIEDGSFTVILGASGSGKSTLLNIISGLERPDGGNVMYGEKDITVLTDSELTKFRKENVGLVFQQYYTPRSSPAGRCSVQLSHGRWPNGRRYCLPTNRRALSTKRQAGRYSIT